MQFKKKLNNLNKLYIFFFYFVLFININSISKASANLFKINDLEISEPFSVKFNKEKVINRAFKDAFNVLVSMITTSSDQKKIKKTSINTVKTLVDSFTMSNEKFIDDMYIVNFDVNFNKKNTLKFFETKNIFPSIPRKKTVLLIPVYVDIQSNQISIFNDNIFYDNWNLNDERFFLLNYILPTEDIEDINLLLENRQFIEGYNFEKTIEKYDLKDFIIVIIYKNYDDLKILSKIKINNNLKIDNQTFKNINIDDSKSLTETLLKLKNTYENHWKDINKVNTSLKLSLNILIDSSDYDKIFKFENLIHELDLVFNYEITKFDKDIIHYKLIYNGAPNKFLDDLESRGMKINIENKNWKIE